MLMIGGVALGAIVLVIIFAMSGNKNAAAKTPDDPSKSAPANAQNTNKPTPPSKPETGVAKPGSTPDRPAPEIVDGSLEKADEMYREAARIWNKAQEARREGTTADYQQALLDSWDVLNELFASVSAYTEWYEEADLEGWAIPASYDRLQKMLDKWDPLRMKVKKLKPMSKRR